MRLANWEERLGAVVAAALGEGFVWGRHDCCTFAADAVVACTGRDVMGELRGTYGSVLTAMRVLESEGGLAAAVTARLGAPIAPLTAQRGDVVMHEVEGYPALGVVTGTHAMAPMARGVQRIPARSWVNAWRVD